MRCDAPPRECLAWHIAPKLGAALNGDLDHLRGRCPAHDDDNPSLSVSAGQQQRIVWHCHAGCPADQVRAAMIKAGVHPGCLPRTRTDDQQLADTMAEVIFSGRDHAAARLVAAATYRGYSQLPRGAALRGLATEVQVSRAQAFRVKAEESPTPATAVRTPRSENLSSTAGQSIGPQSHGETESHGETTWDGLQSHGETGIVQVKPGHVLGCPGDHDVAGPRARRCRRPRPGRRS